MELGRKRLLLVACIVMLQLVSVYALVLNLQRELTAQFDRNAAVTLEELADSAVDRSRRFLRPAHDAVGVGLRLIDERILDSGNDAALGIFFEAQLAMTPWLAGLYVGRSDGSFVYLARNEFGLRTKTITIEGEARTVELVQRDASGVITERWTDEEDAYDPRTRAWYTAATGSTGIAWTAPYQFFSSGLPGLTVAGRSRDGVVMGADVQIDELSAFIEQIPHAENGTALILDADDNVIARSSGDALRDDLPSDRLPTLDDVIATPLLTLHASERPEDELQRQRIDGSDHLGLVRRFPFSDAESRWTLLVQMRADDYAGGALNFFDRRILVLGALSLGLGLLALAGLLWLHRRSRGDLSDARGDGVFGALGQPLFERALRDRASGTASSTEGRLGVLVVEPIGLRRLADRLGRTAAEAVLLDIGKRLKEALQPNDVLGISPNERFLVALDAPDRDRLAARFHELHAAIERNGAFSTPFGPQTLAVASGAAMLEIGEPIDNLLPRAREALTLGVDERGHGCRLAGGLNDAPTPIRQKAA